MLVIVGVALITFGLLLAVAVVEAVHIHLRDRDALLESKLLHIHDDLASARKEIKAMAITQEDVRDLANAVGRLITIAQNALTAAADDKAAKDQAVADLTALRGEVAWLNDPDLDQQIDDMIDAASAATPADEPPPAE